MTSVWILNHYATLNYVQQGGRHYWLGRKLRERGYKVDIFAASTIHGVDGTSQIHGHKTLQGVDYHFLETPRYKGRAPRALNMLAFYSQLLRLMSGKHGVPDVIYASSVHPLTLLAGIQIARHFGIPCICEVRDLWPLSIEAYAPRLRNTLLTRVLYAGERLLYKWADEVVFTVPLASKYIEQMRWQESVPTSKIHYINNGIDVASFSELTSIQTKASRKVGDCPEFTVVYAGSIRRVNKVSKIVEVAEVLQRRNCDDIRIFIYGDGDERSSLERNSRHLRNLSFEGAIPKSEVPSVLASADSLIFHGDQGVLAQYGSSMNKLFEYLASGTPIISDCRYGDDPVERSGAGIVCPDGTASELADAIVQLKQVGRGTLRSMAQRAKIEAAQYDFEQLTTAMEGVINKATHATGDQR